jgi:MSHA biogenesis protein MshQ
LNYQISARGSNNGVLSNYDSLRIPGLTGAVTLAAENANDGINLGGRLVVDTAPWVAGVVTLADADAAFNRTALPDGPFADLSVGVAVTDAVDSRPMFNPNMDAATNGDCALASSCTAVEIGQPDLYYGRLMVLPANGPEDRALNVDLEAQYFDGVAFREFAQDSCSTYQAGLASLSNYQDNLDDGETSVVSPVLSSTLLMGHADTATPLQLSAPGVNNEGRAILELQVPGWLQYDWFGAGLASPRNDVTFGRFRGHDRIIIWQQDPAD